MNRHNNINSTRSASTRGAEADSLTLLRRCMTTTWTVV